MIYARSKFTVAVVAFALVSACQQEPQKNTTADPEPFWQAKPSIPYRPSDFCGTSRRLMSSLPNSVNFRCQGNLVGGLGARVDVSDVQVVLLQGAKSEWFMFAYELRKDGRSAISYQTLQRLQGDLEQALQVPQSDSGPFPGSANQSE